MLIYPSTSSSRASAMAMALGAKPVLGGGRVEAFDRHVSVRMRDRRIALGFTLQRFAELIGVAYPQACKYEKGINRISAGRLYRIARALNVDIGYFFEGIELGSIRDEELMPRPLLLALMRNFVAIPVRKHQEEIISLARALAEPDAMPPGGPEPG